MILLKEVVPETDKLDPAELTPRVGEDTGTQDDLGVRVSEANTGQLGPESRTELLKILEEFNGKGLFPRNPKVVPVVHGREVPLPLIDENVTPVACKPQKYSPMAASIVNKQSDVWHEATVTRHSTSSWCSQTVLVPKSNGEWRVCIDYRALNKLLKTDSGGLGDISAMHDRIKGSKYFTLLDLPQAYHQLPIKEEDRHKTAFRDATGRLFEFNCCSFGLQTIPAVFSASLGDLLRELRKRGGLESWLDDVLLHNKTLAEHLAAIRELLQLLVDAGYSVHFGKSEFCFSEVEFLGVMVGRDGTRAAPSKVKAIQEMAMPTNVGEVRAFLGIAGFLRGFIPNFSALVAPISDLLRNKAFNSRRARRLPVPWGHEQAAAFLAVIEALTSHPVLALPNWFLPFMLHTDASTLAAGGVLTQEVEGRDAPVGYSSKRFSRAEEKLSANDREVLGVLHALDHFQTYLQHRRFTLVTDCAALLWLFTSQNLSPKMHRWAMRMMQYDMDLRWRKGTDHVAPDALSRLQRKGPPGPDIDTSFPDDPTTAEDGKGPIGPVLDGQPLQDLATPEEDDDNKDQSTLAEPGQDEVRLDGVSLTALGATSVQGPMEGNLAVLYALQLTPDTPQADDTRQQAIHAEVQTFLTPRQPTAVVLGCGAGGALLAVEGFF